MPVINDLQAFVRIRHIVGVAFVLRDLTKVFDTGASAPFRELPPNYV